MILDDIHGSFKSIIHYGYLLRTLILNRFSYFAKKEFHYMINISVKYIQLYVNIFTFA